MNQRLSFLLIFIFVLVGLTTAHAHEVRPALLQIFEERPGNFTITWKQPVVGELALPLIPHLSGGWLDQPPTDQFATPQFLIRKWTVNSKNSTPLAQQTLTIEGLEKSITDVIVSVNTFDGSSTQLILRPDLPSASLATALKEGEPVTAYLRLGVTHILTGIDHLLFVLGLVLVVGVHWRLLGAVTAFTVAHSVTLAASALHFVHPDPALIEALVALSIVFMATELANALQGRQVLTQRYPWMIAFTFGLLHGFAFASSLAEIGLPRDAIPLSLFLFNVGVEIGQLLFIAVVIAAQAVIGPRVQRLPMRWRGAVQWSAPYAIGICATFWFIERTFVAFSS